MSDEELARLEVLRDLDQCRLTTEVAAQSLGAGAPSGVPPVKAYLPHRGSGWFDFRSATVAPAIVLDQHDAGVEQVLLLAHRAF